MKRRLEVVYQTDRLLVINKPAGLLSLPDRYNPLESNLYGLLCRQFERVFVVHRLDRDTSGLMVFALDAEAHRVLSEQFERRRVQKTYLALVEGVPEEEFGEICTGIEKVPNKPGRMRVGSRGKPAVSEFRLLRTWGVYSLLSIRIRTGRTHQIRVHLSHIGLPIVGDAFYGSGRGLYVSRIKHKRFKLKFGKQERPLIARTALHAQKLSFDLPGGKQRIHLEAPLPKDFRAGIQQLDKWLGSR